MFTYSEPHLLSSGGSVRGTSYGFSNKSITLNGKTHVVWLDRPAGVRGKTYDHRTKAWGPTINIDEGSDNHTSPALFADSFDDAHLRLIIGPHGAGWNSGQFRWAISDQPGSLEKWKWHHNVGYAGTYPAPTHTPVGIDAMVYRGGEWPPSLMFQRQLQGTMRCWTKAKELFRTDVGPQYTHYGAYLEADAHGTLYAACHFYTQHNSQDHDDPRNCSRGVAIIKSTDHGATWTTMLGEPIALPAYYERRFGVPPLDEPNMTCGGLAIDSTGTVWVISTDAGVRTRSVYLSKWTPHGWHTRDIGRFVPETWMVCDTFLTIDSKDRPHLAITALLPDKMPDKKTLTWWGHASCEVFHMASLDGGDTFSCKQISKTDPSKPSWLPNISKNSPYHRVDNPVIVYTHGEPGLIKKAGSNEMEEALTEVYCVFVNEV